MNENHKATNPKDAIASNKAPLHLCPDTLAAAASMAFLEGGLKYGPYNWREAGARASVYYDAGRRHFEAWWNGQNIDEASGLPHLWKLAACVAILIECSEIGNLTDDRPPPLDLYGMFNKMEPEVERLKAKLQKPNVPCPNLGRLNGIPMCDNVLASGIHCQLELGHSGECSL